VLARALGLELSRERGVRKVGPVDVDVLVGEEQRCGGEEQQRDGRATK